MPRMLPIETLTPADGAFVNRVPEIRVLVLDRSGEGIDFEKSTIGRIRTMLSWHSRKQRLR